MTFRLTRLNLLNTMTKTLIPLEFHEDLPVEVSIKRIRFYVAIVGDKIITFDNDPDRALSKAADKLTEMWNQHGWEKVLEEREKLICFPATNRLVEALPSTSWDLREDNVVDLCQ